MAEAKTVPPPSVSAAMDTVVDAPADHKQEDAMGQEVKSRSTGDAVTDTKDGEEPVTLSILKKWM